MAAILMLGKDVSEQICNGLRARVEALATAGRRPRLTILRVGERKDDISYEVAAIKRCDLIGIDAENIALPVDIPQEELIAQIEELNNNRRVSGIMLFRPLPEHINEQEVCEAIAPEKDVDGLCSRSMAMVYSGYGAGFTPCTACACMTLLERYKVPIVGKRAVVIGRSLVIGRPVAMLLMRAGATVIICHSKTENLADITRQADIVVTAAGRGEPMGPEFFSAGQTVLDVGMNWDAVNNKLLGDVDIEAVKDIAGAISPVPVGVGAVTASILAEHVTISAERALERDGL